MAEILARGHITIVAVNDGADGSDAVEVSLSPPSLTLNAKTTSTGNALADTSTGNTATIRVVQGGKDITAACQIALGGTVNCTASVSAQGKVTVRTVTADTIDGRQIARTSASVIVAVRVPSTGNRYAVSLPVAVSVSAVWGSLKTDMSGLQSQYTRLENDLQSDSPEVLSRYTSTIRQSAEEIALMVSRTSVGRVNLFVGSGLRRQGEGARTKVCTKDVRGEERHGAPLCEKLQTFPI